MAMGPPWEGHGIAGQRQTCVLWQTGPGTPCRGCSPPARAVLTVSQGSRLSCRAQDPEHGELRHLCSASVKLVTRGGSLQSWVESSPHLALSHCQNLSQGISSPRSTRGIGRRVWTHAFSAHGAPSDQRPRGVGGTWA